MSLIQTQIKYTNNQLQRETWADCSALPLRIGGLINDETCPT